MLTLNQVPRAKPQLCKTLQKARPRGELREAETFFQVRHFVLHTKTLLCWGFLRCVPARKSNEEYEVVIIGKNRWCCHVGFLKKKKKKVRKEKNSYSFEVNVEWNHCKRAQHGMQPLSMSGSERFRPRGSRPVSTKPSHQWTQTRRREQPNLPLILHQESTVCMGAT